MPVAVPSSHRSLEDLLATAESRSSCFATRRPGQRLPGSPAGVHELARRAAGLAGDLRPLRPVVPHERPRGGGPDAPKLLSQLAVNNLDGFGVDRAKHFVPCSPEGYVIGDVILFALGDDRFNLVGRAPALNWILYHAETGGYDVAVDLDLRTALRSDGRRRSYRFQVQGPTAMHVIEEALDGPLPELRFFHTTAVAIAGKTAGALRHGAVGQPGWELFGPWDDREAVLDALVTAGEELGLRRAGGRAYSSNTLESGWIPSPLPAVYSGVARGPTANGFRRPDTKARRRSAAASSPATSRTTTSAVGRRLRDYVKFDHDFVGRDALVEMAERDHRRKVAGARRRRRDAHARDDVPGGDRAVHGLALRRVLDAPVRPGHCRRRRSASRPGSATAPTRARC